jgi:hypothetical protein
MNRAFREGWVRHPSSVLNSDRAVEMSLFVVRAFVRLREMLSTHRELATSFPNLLIAYRLLFIAAFLSRPFDNLTENRRRLAGG